MKCQYCKEEIADNSEKCSQCGSDLLNPCPFCREQIPVEALVCEHCGSTLSQKAPPSPLPPGVAGWSWGAFLFNWIWAIGNKVWIGLIALVPVAGFIMSIILGFKGREWAWKSRQWDSVEHFNRVQKKWSQWAVGLTVVLGLGGILAAIAIPSFVAYKVKAHNAAASSSLRNLTTSLESTFSTKKTYPESLEKSGFTVPADIIMKCSINPSAYICAAAHKNGTIMYLSDNKTPRIEEQPYLAGAALQLPFLPPVQEAAAPPETGTATSAVQPEAQPQQNVTGQPAIKASFDCTKASGKAQRLICSNQKLAEADSKLARVYRSALRSDPDPEGLRREQAEWVIHQRDICTDVSEMLQVYRDRISELTW